MQKRKSKRKIIKGSNKSAILVFTIVGLFTILLSMYLVTTSQNNKVIKANAIDTINQRTDGNLPSSSYQGRCISNPPLSSPEGYEWHANCSAPTSCYIDEVSKLSGNTVEEKQQTYSSKCPLSPNNEELTLKGYTSNWCYGFEGDTKSNKDFRCVVLKKIAKQTIRVNSGIGQGNAFDLENSNEPTSSCKIEVSLKDKFKHNISSATVNILSNEPKISTDSLSENTEMETYTSHNKYKSGTYTINIIYPSGDDLSSTQSYKQSYKIEAPNNCKLDIELEICNSDNPCVVRSAVTPPPVVCPLSSRTTKEECSKVCKIACIQNPAEPRCWSCITTPTPATTSNSNPVSTSNPPRLVIDNKCSIYFQYISKITFNKSNETITYPIEKYLNNFRFGNQFVFSLAQGCASEAIVWTQIPKESDKLIPRKIKNINCTPGTYNTYTIPDDKTYCNQSRW
ncbi:MAG: hypothetical protein WCO06_02985 [Candidatus Roizmanbacteria bacterium]